MAPRPAGGRRERNKQEKLERIVTAARDLFAERGVAEVTTQQIAARADVASGTLFLYARSKSELLLLVQNSTYAEALDRGRKAAAELDSPVEAVLAILGPIVECNREQPANGRVYLREVMFGDPGEPHHRQALTLVQQTEAAVAAVLPHTPATTARIILGILLLSMSSPLNADRSAGEIIEQIRTQVAVLLPG